MPDHRSPEEISLSVAAAKKRIAKKRLAELNKEVKSGRIVILVVGILQFLVACYYAFGPLNLIESLYIDGAIAAIFIGLFFYGKTQPKTAFLIALILYTLVQVIVVIEDPSNIYKGLILKAAFYYLVIKGYNAVGKIPKRIVNEDVLDQSTLQEEIEELY
jgi:hypothetical protein